MTTALIEQPHADAIEHALVAGDLSKLTAGQRLAYYHRVCDSLGLNPLTKPFAYITLNGKLTLYALKDCTEQLRANRQISVQIAARETVEDCYVVTARASYPDGRHDESIGAVPLAGLKGEARANAMMKAETKAKRRVTLSICGLGMLDETEVEAIQPTVVVEPLAALPGASSSNGKTAAFEAEDAGSSPAEADGPLRIMRVERKPTKNPNVTKVTVILSDGRQVSTINTALANLAEEVCQTGDPVDIDTKATKWGEDLLAIRRLEREIQLHGDEHGPVSPDDSIPF